MVSDGHAGSQVKVAELGAELAEADAGGVCDLSAAIQVQLLYITTVLGKSPANNKHTMFSITEFY